MWRRVSGVKYCQAMLSHGSYPALLIHLRCCYRLGYPVFNTSGNSSEIAVGSSRVASVNFTRFVPFFTLDTRLSKYRVTAVKYV